MTDSPGQTHGIAHLGTANENSMTDSPGQTHNIAHLVTADENSTLYVTRTDAWHSPPGQNQILYSSSLGGC